MAVQKRLESKCKLQEQAEEGSAKKGGSSKTSKQQWKERLGLKATKMCREEEELEEIEEEVDDENDPDYEPEKDPEKDFVAEDMELNEEDTFEIEKHVHAINLQEAGDYVVEIRRFVSCFGKVVCKAKVDISREYRKLIHFMREKVLKIGSYSPAEHADEEAVFRTIVDPTCTAWRRALHGAKTGNAKDIQ